MAVFKKIKTGLARTKFFPAECKCLNCSVGLRLFEQIRRKKLRLRGPTRRPQIVKKNRWKLRRMGVPLPKKLVTKNMRVKKVILPYKKRASMKALLRSFKLAINK